MIEEYIPLPRTAIEYTIVELYTIELDEKFCDVIVKRYIEQVGSSKDVKVQRDGLTYSFDEVGGTNE